MPQSLELKIAGLYTDPSSLSEVPPGAFWECNNFVHDRDGILSKRRGFSIYGDLLASNSNRAEQLFSYKNTILRHSDGVLEWDDGSGNFSAFATTGITSPTQGRIRGTEVNSNLYFTSSTGIRKISARTIADLPNVDIENAGGLKALDLNTTPNYSQAGFLTPLSKVAYRVVWGIKDINSNLILGRPSEISVVSNISETDSCIVDLTFPIPSGVTEQHFYQIYRSQVIQSPTLAEIDEFVPEDELSLVVEDFPTTLTGSLTITDIVPEDFRAGGAFLYTNSISGGGIGQANDPPPIATDIALFRGYTFYSNTKSIHRLNLDLLSTNDFVSGDTKLLISNGATTNVFTFRGEEAISTIVWATANYGAITALDGRYFFVRSPSNKRLYFVWFDSTGSVAVPNALDTVGAIPIKVTTTGSVTNEDIVNDIITATSTVTDFTITKTGTGTDVTMTITNNYNGNTDPWHIQNSATNAVPAPIGGTITFNNETTAGLGENAATQTILLSSRPTAGQRIEETAKSIVNIINAQSTGVVYAFYLSGINDVPGLMLFESRVLEDVPFYVGMQETTSGANLKFNPSLPDAKTVTSYTLADPAVFTVTSHGYSTDDNVIIYGTTGDTPNIDNIHVATNLTVNTFSIPVNTSGGVLGTGSRVFLASVVSENEEVGNRLYYSKYEQPDAVPLLNYIDIGPKDRQNIRIVSLRENLFIFKEDGIYRLTGENPTTFAVSLLDSSAILIADDSIAILNNLVYGLSSQGVITISDGGIEIKSKGIENLLKEAQLNPEFKYATCATASESDRAYYLFMPRIITDIYNNQCFRYNGITRSWARYTKGATSCVVNFGDDKIYIGASDLGAIEQERKNFDRTDFADREYTNQLGQNCVNGKIINLLTLTNVAVGDVVYQLQYLTLAQFNRLLKRLDIDNGLNDSDYYSTLLVQPGDNLINHFLNLTIKLNADDTNSFTDSHGNTSYTYGSPASMEGLQTVFNNLIDRLNESTTIALTNYDSSVGSTSVEAVIVEIDEFHNITTLYTELPWLEGNVIIYKMIASSVKWVANPLGDPSTLKRLSDTTVVFEDLSFTFCEARYASDLIKAYTMGSLFYGDGIGIFGQVLFGDEMFGGIASSRPLRTYIPQNVARCRKVSTQLKHYVAREDCKILGLSMTYDITSTRGYRN